MGAKLKYRVKIGSPCTQDWSRMAGDARERYCVECERQVHNFAAMTSREIERLITKSEGRLCGRIEHTADGRLVTADLVAIDSGWKGIASRTPALAGAALTALLSVASGAAAQSAASSGTTSTAQAASANSETKAAAPAATQTPEPSHGRAIIVTDQSGAPIPGASVTLTKRDSKQVFNLTSDNEGRASLHGIPHGDYDVAATATGFRTETRYDVALPANTRTTLYVGGLMGDVVLVDSNPNPIRHFFSKLKTYL